MNSEAGSDTKGNIAVVMEHLKAWSSDDRLVGEKDVLS